MYRSALRLRNRKPDCVPTLQPKLNNSTQNRFNITLQNIKLTERATIKLTTLRKNNDNCQPARMQGPAVYSTRLTRHNDCSSGRRGRSLLMHLLADTKDYASRLIADCLIFVCIYVSQTIMYSYL